MPTLPTKQPRRRHHAATLLAGLALLASVSLLAAAPAALAAGEPEWIGPPESGTILKIHSTRVLLVMELRREGLAAKWKAEYAPVVCGGSVPTTGWTVTNEEEISAESAQVDGVVFGARDPGEGASAPIQLRKLKPETCYDARFSATNADSKVNGKGEPEAAEAVVPFRTLPAETPEVPKGGEGEEFTWPIFDMEEVTDTSAVASAKIETNGAEATYGFEYALPESGHAPVTGSASWKPFTSGATGKVTVAEDYADVKAKVMGLSPETTYYVRIKLSNSAGTTYQTEYQVGAGESETFRTGTAKPREPSLSVRNVTGASAHIAGLVAPDGSETVWRFESASPVSGACPSGSGGSWALVPGGEGRISQAQAGATSYFTGVGVGVGLSGLSASSLSCVRLSASNVAGGAESGVVSFETEGPPAVSTFMAHRLTGETLEFLGSVNPNAVPTSAEQSIVVSGATGGTFTLTFNGQTTAPLAYDAPASAVEEAFKHLSGGPEVSVEGLAGGPYTVAFVDRDAGSSQPPIEANAGELTPAPPASGVTVATTQAGGEAYTTHYWFQYVSDRAFEVGGWSSPEETAHVESGFGDAPQLASVGAPGLKGGEGYRYRLVAESTLSSGSLLVGGEQSLVGPATPAVSGSAACPNEAFRVGLSAVLPDCRVYEQVTPVDKEGAQEPFHYKGGEPSAVLVGEDGDHALLEAPEVSYGSGPASGQAPYLFTRGDEGWSTVAGSRQPETGIHSVAPQAYSEDLTQIAFESAYSPGPHSESPEVEYKIGPLGGPYRKVASVSRRDSIDAEETEEGSGWVAANGGFSKLVLETRDRVLLGEEAETGTKSGSDLYEYTPGGGLRQLNVTGSGSEAITIGTCGARMVKGEEDPESYHRESSPHSVSADGSRVFFEAAPGRDCSEARNLYMRVNGAETVNVGAYKFVAADTEGTRLLLRNGAGELVGYDTLTNAFEAQPVEQGAEERELAFLGVPVRYEPQESDTFTRPRYTYWAEQVNGSQASRYDAAEHLVQCISCASSFDPNPKQDAWLGDKEGIPDLNGGLPDFTAVSGNGKFAFFTTISELLPQDVDGEIQPEYDCVDVGHCPGSSEYVNVGGHASPSTDVYEWRAPGVDGCAQLEGCLALITDGRGGYLNLLLGTADEGEDVFIYTRSVLSPLDGGVEGSIGEGNIYDVRADGGFAPPPPAATECEADACVTPPGAPNDATPSSLTFSGVGNVLPTVTPAPSSAKPKGKVKAKPKKGKPKKKRKQAKSKRSRGKAKGSAHINRGAKR